MLNNMLKNILNYFFAIDCMYSINCITDYDINYYLHLVTVIAI